MIEIKEMHLEKSGTPLWKIIEELGNKSYFYIECRYKWADQDGDHDDFWGCCSYNNETKMLSSVDGDSYSLNDLYDEWVEWQADNGEQCLTVWEYGV